MSNSNTTAAAPIDALLNEMRALLRRAYALGEQDGAQRLLAAAGMTAPAGVPAPKRKPYVAKAAAEGVLEYARRRRSVRAKAVAAAFGISRSAADQHLFKLTRAGSMKRVSPGIYAATGVS